VLGLGLDNTGGAKDRLRCWSNAKLLAIQILALVGLQEASAHNSK
jgi:hypothetical protein